MASSRVELLWSGWMFVCRLKIGFSCCWMNALSCHIKLRSTIPNVCTHMCTNSKRARFLHLLSLPVFILPLHRLCTYLRFHASKPPSYQNLSTLHIPYTSLSPSRLWLWRCSAETNWILVLLFTYNQPEPDASPTDCYDLTAKPNKITAPLIKVNRR
jgi:hypothetical protein